MINNFHLKVVILGGFLATVFSVFAQPSEGVLIVGTKIAPPFAMKDKNGEWEGISVELWQRVASELGHKYEWKELGLQQLVEGVSDSSLDVGVAALTITAERESMFDFSHSYYSTGLSIAVPKTSGSGWIAIIKGVFSWQMLVIVLILISTLFVVGALAWLLERKKNPKSFNPKVIPGIANGIWWAAVTMTTVGYGDMTPKSLGGRIVALFWMFASLLLISAVIAGATSALTIAKIKPLVAGPEDLAKARIATIENSTSDHYLKGRRLQRHYYVSVEEGLSALSQGKVDAMVYDAPLLKYLVNLHFEENLKVVDKVFEFQHYGIAFPENSPLREPVNRIMLDMIRQPEWQEIQRKYLGD